jgi:hypothetical protein
VNKNKNTNEYLTKQAIQVKESNDKNYLLRREERSSTTEMIFDEI